LDIRANLSEIIRPERGGGRLFFAFLEDEKPEGRDDDKGGDGNNGYPAGDRSDIHVNYILLIYMTYQKARKFIQFPEKEKKCGNNETFY
jgi:hypothetical protein